MGTLVGGLAGEEEEILRDSGSGKARDRLLMIRERGLGWVWDDVSPFAC